MWILSISIELTWIKLDPIRLNQFNFKADWMLTDRWVWRVTWNICMHSTLCLTSPWEDTTCVIHQNSPCRCCSKKLLKKKSVENFEKEKTFLGACGWARQGVQLASAPKIVSTWNGECHICLSFHSNLYGVFWCPLTIPGQPATKLR